MVVGHCFCRCWLLCCALALHCVIMLLLLLVCSCYYCDIICCGWLVSLLLLVGLFYNVKEDLADWTVRQSSSPVSDCPLQEQLLFIALCLWPGLCGLSVLVCLSLWPCVHTTPHSPIQCCYCCCCYTDSNDINNNDNNNNNKNNNNNNNNNND